ncbi:hypothetical protein [Prevotella communis]|uniref:hypothetical protein n=1 Tax=Prevotella communis TaxID=2913614 RepID=UPI001EDAE67D|nr:hypothetical protein [Prevotella communis]UKK57337.1 hypothetical protein L6476_03550 [Prevotella communis]UKK62745.1 hypothetical protein L6468_02980 [Prevotella communis]UKK65570.1 hypothetical protein L6473_02975 [Prevotella communis]UKK68003.1 hypothetical protein L6464_01390 [Prevotella communis]UKK69862.1 hypothetical protein L6466_11095 [Prevotella communis]
MKKIDDILNGLQGQQPDVSNPDEWTDRIMDSLPDLPTEQPKPARRIRLYIASAIAAAASVLLLISLGIVTNNQNDEGNNLVVQTDTTIVSPQTGTKEVETLPQEKKESKEMADTVKRVKEILHMSKPSKHYMAKAETTESTLEPEFMDATELAEKAIAEEMRRMEMAVQINGSLQTDFQKMTREIRQRGKHMTQQVEMAINNEEY